VIISISAAPSGASESRAARRDNNPRLSRSQRSALLSTRDCNHPRTNTSRIRPTIRRIRPIRILDIHGHRIRAFRRIRRQRSRAFRRILRRRGRIRRILRRRVCIRRIRRIRRERVALLSPVLQVFLGRKDGRSPS